MIAVLAILFQLASIGNAARDIDRVATLPGYSDSVPPSKHYSGCNNNLFESEVYIEVNYLLDIPTGTLTASAGELHYWFIESENAPASDPVVLWLNGGPGSSSLIGLLTENGQIVTNDDSLTSPIEGFQYLIMI